MKENKCIFLTDEETGEEIEFEIIDAIEEEGERFILVVPIDDQEDGADTALILKDVSKDEEEAIYELVEDNDEFTKAAAYFMEESNDYDLEF